MTVEELMKELEEYDKDVLVKLETFDLKSNIEIISELEDMAIVKGDLILFSKIIQ